ncbi:sugar nucleotide-binding protein [Rasiella rasia]|uniref:dTDP-4-dehydrorhamnose reductase n=1 Tax=Rasiella rasia TaxID=2744027 RepID=A0A6G6GJA7_9FLAO|nr:sugar nucleotide-binding protein [Rasiella rasia]QIE58503.1 sugar nucleotide-binding protein [Rasiella rasia]
MSEIPTTKHTILILGASGFIGNAIYRELGSYFKTYGTYCSQDGMYGANQIFFKYDLEHDSIAEILEETQPSVIISSLRGNFNSQYQVHSELAKYVRANHECRLLYLSSVNVFDGLFQFPAFEADTPKAESDYGRHKINIERMLQEEIPAQFAILRLPMVLGVHAPRLIQLRQASKHKAAFEVFPNLIISVTTADKIAQQVHYIVNQQLDGIFHLASEDVIHHEDLFRELCEKLGNERPVFKSVYKRNEDSYLALLPKKNKLPKSYRITVSEVIDACTLKEEISTFKN